MGAGVRRHGAEDGRVQGRGGVGRHSASGAAALGWGAAALAGTRRRAWRCGGRGAAALGRGAAAWARGRDRRGHEHLAAWARRGAAQRRGGGARRLAVWWRRGGGGKRPGGVVAAWGRREAARRRRGGVGAAWEERKEVSEEKKRGRRPKYYSTALPSARSRALGKDFFKNFKIHFAECLNPGTRQSIF
jgi:hypothetical protein